MREQNDSFAGGDAAAMSAASRRSSEHIIHARQPDAGAIALDRLRLVREHLNVRGLEAACYVFGSVRHRDSQDGPKTMGCSHLLNEAGAWFDCVSAAIRSSPDSGRNKVSGEHDKIGTKAVDHGDRGAQRMDGKVRVIVEIAEQGNGKAIQTFRPARKEKILAHDARTVRLEQNRISGKRDGADCGGAAKELASLVGRKDKQT